MHLFHIVVDHLLLFCMCVCVSLCESAWHHYTRLLTVICLLFSLCVVQLVALFEMVNKIAVSRQSSANCFHFVGQQQSI